jgi:hypothetical protein
METCDLMVDFFFLLLMQISLNFMFGICSRIELIRSNLGSVWWLGHVASKFILL